MSKIMDRVYFKVNGNQHSVGCEVSSDVMLVDYLRDYLELRGTKYMCREGGCGACCVSVRKCADGPLMSVNSCLVSITSCQDWEITTIEEIGNRKKGYHVLQKTLAEYNGTQCGYCTPGWIQNMYSLIENGNKPTMLDIEKSFGSNVCRCTGYRPILETFKKFGCDAPIETRIMDIEDLHICKKTGLSCDKTKCDDDNDDWCMLSHEEVLESKVIKIELQDNKLWYKVYNLKSIFDIFKEQGTESYMLVCGNTAKGAYGTENTNIMIDITAVEELKGYTFDQNLIIGVGVTLNVLIDIFKTVAKEEYFRYLEKFAKHVDLVAHIPVRNIGSLGGNLMLKHQHNNFASDLFLLFETVGAYLTIATSTGVVKSLSMQQFLKEDMRGKILINVMLPPLSDQYKLVTYKVMPRSQSAHAIVNAGFLYKIASNNYVIEARIVYGGLSPSFVRAEATERFLRRKPLFSNTTLQAALHILQTELVVTENPPDTSVAYRKQLALSLFYKGQLSLCPKGILNARYVSGSTTIHETRPVSKATQSFETDSTLWPLNQPIQKTEALIQCAGETKYTDDLHVQPGEVHAAFVLSTIAVGDIVHIDASLALKQPGVLAFYTAADIPGVNSFTPAGTPFLKASEEVLANGKVVHFNQPIGIVVAETHHIAYTAAAMVTATYTNVKDPVTDIKVAKNDSSRVTLFFSKEPTDKGTDIVKTIKGTDNIYGQYHFMMENMSCISRPTETGLECHLTTQWMDGCQQMISKALNMDENKVDVYTRRLGGAFGMKVTRAAQVAVACSLVVHKMNRPCRFMLPLTTCTRAIGKRFPCSRDYEVNVSATGKIQSILSKQYEDDGHKINEMVLLLALDSYNNCYTNTFWDYSLYDVVTDTAKNTWCRGPGTLEGVSMAEYVLERISYELCLDPFEVRKTNLDTKYNDLIAMSEDLKMSASYIERRANVDKFNSENRWKKRGLRCSFMRWTPAGPFIFDVTLSICHGDGTVIITHGGIEMGQGINTKAVQICAYFFNIPIDKIQIKGNNTIITPNCSITGASMGSQSIGIGVQRCCETMLERLAPIKSQLTNPTWLELILKAFESDIDLLVHSYVGATDLVIADLFGVAIAEAEVDVLTGESEILRVDLVQDVGQSVSPNVDIGQIEGAFIMGLGYWTCEDLVYNRTTGELLSDRPWNYYVPLARDIPQDFRVAFRKNSYGPKQVLGSKVTGEPSICLTISVAFALREAISAARKEIGIPSTTWFDVEGPYTVEKINLASGLRKEDFLFT